MPPYTFLIVWTIEEAHSVCEIDNLLCNGGKEFEIGNVCEY